VWLWAPRHGRVLPLYFTEKFAVTLNQQKTDRQTEREKKKEEEEVEMMMMILLASMLVEITYYLFVKILHTECEGQLPSDIFTVPSK
jgi:hypothetical protein